MSSGYAPPPPPLGQPPAYGPLSAPAGRGSGKKIIWIVLAAVLGAVMLIVLFIGTIVAAIFGSMRSSEPYRFAMQKATHDPRVLSKLGSPIKPGWFITGSISVQNDSGQADLFIPIQGATHKGKIHVVGTKSEGAWAYQILTLDTEDREDGVEQLNLLPQPNATTEEK